jgi:hypothetical protein
VIVRARHAGIAAAEPGVPGTAETASDTTREAAIARMPGHPWTTGMFIAVAVGIVLNSFFAYPTQSLIGSSILAAATVGFFVMRKSFVTP